MKIGLLIVALAITGVPALASDIAVENTLPVSCEFAFSKKDDVIGKWHKVNNKNVSTVGIKKDATHMIVSCSDFDADKRISIKQGNVYKTRVKISGWCNVQRETQNGKTKDVHYCSDLAAE